MLMAGDWLKLSKSTPDKPEVFSIADRLKIDPDAVVGKLLRVWGWFDEHTTDGNAPCATCALLDRLASVSGFADAMLSVGWLVTSERGLSLPNFDRHNSQTAKKRSLTSRRVAVYRARSNAPSVTCALPREEVEVEKNQGTGSGQRDEADLQLDSAERDAGRALPESLDKPEFRYAWRDWLVHWSKTFGRSRPMPDATSIEQLRGLAAIGSERAMAAIKNSIARGNLSVPAEPYSKTKKNADDTQCNGRGFDQSRVNDYSTAG
jgi:hypothetical protein